VTDQAGKEVKDTLLHKDQEVL